MRVRGSVSLKGDLDVRGLGAALGGRALAAMRGHYFILLQARSNPIKLSVRLSCVSLSLRYEV